MYVTRGTVIELLVRDKHYEDNMTILKMLPEDSVFEIVIEDTVTAEHYDGKSEEMLIFNIDFSYETPSIHIHTKNEAELERDISESIITSKKEAENQTTNTLKLIPKLIVMAIVLTGVLALYVVYKN